MFLEKRDDFLPDAIAQRNQTPVGRVLPKLQVMRLHVFVDLLAPDGKERAHHLQVELADAMNRDLTHGSKTGRASAAEQIDQECLGQIVSMMAEENGAAPPATSHLGEESIARIPRRCFNRDFFLCGESRHIGYAHLGLEIVFSSELLNETRVRAALSGAQFVVEVTDNKFAIAQFHEVMKQGDRIAAAGDTHEVGRRGRKLPEKG